MRSHTRHLRRGIRMCIASVLLVPAIATMSTATASAQPACNASNPIQLGQTLCAGSSIAQPFNLTFRYYLTMQSDGNLVYYRDTTLIGTHVCWASNTVGHGRYMTYANHTITIYDAHDRPWWSTGDGGGSTINITRSGALYFGLVVVADC